MVQDTENTQTQPNALGLHPLADENAESSKDPVRKAIALLLTRKNQDEIIYLRSPEGLKLMYLRYEIDEKTNPKVCFMFKRSPELKPYYKAIRAWCEDSGFQWKEKVLNGDRYMEIALTPYLDEISKIILEIKQSIFKVKALSVGTNSHKLSFAIDDFHHPYLLALSGLAAVVAMGLLPLYEMFRLPYFGKASINALDWPEIFLIILISIGVFSVRYINRKKDNKLSKNILKIYLARAALLLIISLTLFTY